MSIRKDQIIVVDLEASCWEGYDAPPGQQNEIIEIGVCLISPDGLTMQEKRGIFVRPTESVISEFCTKLTSITQEQLDQHGIAFDAACSILEKDYDSRNRLWASWGSFDRKIFWDQCKRRNVRYPFSKKHVNLKRVYQDSYKNRIGLARAMEANGLAMEGTAHRGDDDAWNTARLLGYMIQQHGVQILRKYGL